MSWRDLLPEENETVTLPWTGGRVLYSESRAYTIRVRPQEFGWHLFKVERNNVFPMSQVDPKPDLLKDRSVGYLVGDHLVPDDAHVDTDPKKITDYSEKVFCLPENIERFSRVRAGRVYPEGPLIFVEEDFPLGPEPDVLNAFLDQESSVTEIKDVVPALDAAFRMASFQRAEAERRRKEIEQQRIAEEAERVRNEKRQEMLEKLGDGAGRRAMAKASFVDAAKAALEVGGAQYLDHRRVRQGEWAVKYRVDGQRLECICDTNLQVIDSGICITEHGGGDFEYGTRGDTWLTLESLPSVVREAISLDKLVVYRHV